MLVVTLRQWQREQLSLFLETLSPVYLLQNTECCVWKSLGKVICDALPLICMIWFLP